MAGAFPDDPTRVSIGVPTAELVGWRPVLSFRAVLRNWRRVALRKSSGRCRGLATDRIHDEPQGAGSDRARAGHSPGWNRAAAGFYGVVLDFSEEFLRLAVSGWHSVGILVAGWAQNLQAEFSPSALSGHLIAEPQVCLD